MKKLVVVLVCTVCVFLSLSGMPVLAGVCDQTLTTGASTTIQVFWEQPGAVYGWSGGYPRNRMYFNGCGESAGVKVNMDDWNRLLSQGKLNGLRYIRKDNNWIYIRKVEGTRIVDIPQERFFDGTTVMYGGNRQKVEEENGEKIQKEIRQKVQEGIGQEVQERI